MAPLIRPTVVARLRHPRPTVGVKNPSRSQPQPQDSEWTEHQSPDPSSEPYFYHKAYGLVTTAKIREPNIRDILERRHDFIKDLDWSPDHHEVVVLPESSSSPYVVNHLECVVQKTDDLILTSRSLLYWSHVFRYPCHRPISASAEQRAIKALHDAFAQNLCSDRESNPAFSTKQILQFFEFFKSYSDQLISDKNTMAKVMVVSYILYRAGYHADDSMPLLRPSLSPKSLSSSTAVTVGLKIFLLIFCCGMPPEYDLRFHVARSEYERTFQSQIWASLITQVAKERSDMNIVAGLILSASGSFLALPDQFYVVQFLTVVCIGLALSCVVIGLNPKASQALEDIKRIDLDVSEADIYKMQAMARSMNQHAILLLLSVFCFFLAILAYTTWNIYKNVSMTKGFTVPFLFSLLALVCLLIILSINLLWNRQVHRHQQSEKIYM